MSHVLGPISRDEVFKLLDLDYEYEAYHYVVNDLTYAVLPTVLRGMALVLYDESTRLHPHDGRCALQRLRFHVEGIGDPDAHRFWVRLRATKIDETLEPAPQLAVVRTLARTNTADSIPRTPTATSLRTSTPFSASGGATRGGGGEKNNVGSAYNTGKRKYGPPEGKWKKHDGGGRYLVWEGTRVLCITCFRLWTVTTGHNHADGICTYVCTQAFAPGRAPAKAPAAPANPPPPLSEWPPSAAPQAHALRELEPPPQEEATQPAAAAAATAA
ncbi:hypothetical protein CYMTET_6461 [Cymbomonas tetramitiformis]|uniref:Uncharacterized protein n=1 Tax=Cymbomonas tetramitiformis TaxID=36881 RepID=A0AAE0GX27_9CHLO|nr:hypothetical protein CYMTET_6461 [Cymbomonas tetramitiformis]